MDHKAGPGTRGRGGHFDNDGWSVALSDGLVGLGLCVVLC